MTDGTNGINISDLTGLSGPLTKLIEVVSSGIGKVYEPTNIKRIAKAKASEIKLIGDALMQNNIVPVNYSNGNISMDTIDSEELVKRAGERMRYQEILKQQNIDSVINTAYTVLENTDEVSEEPVDIDWVLRFMNSIEDISNEHMQDIWGKLLAGEIKQPNTFNLRTLEKLKNLSQHEAVLFKKLSDIAMFSGSSSYIYRDDNLLKSRGIELKDLLNLEECGLIYSQNLGSTHDVEPNSSSSINNKNLIAIFSNSTQTLKTVTVPIYKFTNSGSQLLKVIQSSPDNDFFILSVKNLGEKLNDFTIRICPITSINEDNTITFDQSIELYNT